MRSQLVPLLLLSLLVSCNELPTSASRQAGSATATAAHGDGPQKGPSVITKVVQIGPQPRPGSSAGAKGGSEAAAPGVTVARYEPRHLDPVLEEMRDRDKRWQDAQGEATSKVKKAQKEEKETKRKEKRVLRSSLPDDQRPHGLDDFEQIAHMPPSPQYYTGTCWSFATTSFMESEVIRKTGKRIKLSEMSTVYWEYLAKARRYVDERGSSLFAEGSEPNAVTRAWKAHGAWPLSAYEGVKWEDGRHDHQRMVRDLDAVLDLARDKALWDADTVLGMLRVVLDRDIGAPPERFEAGGEAMTPIAFRDQVLHVNPDDYVIFMSTLEKPYWKKGALEVPDNWWHDASYHNVPLADFYGAIEAALRAGYSVVVGTDVSEPGKDPENDVMFIPDYDIPAASIGPMSREYRLKAGVTTDDHAIHLVGFTELAGHTWFLSKDSGRSARHGKVKGYYFVRDDFIRLKALSFMVNKEAVVDVLKRFSKE